MDLIEGAEGPVKSNERRIQKLRKRTPYAINGRSPTKFPSNRSRFKNFLYFDLSSTSFTKVYLEREVIKLSAKIGTRRIKKKYVFFKKILSTM